MPRKRKKPQEFWAVIDKLNKIAINENHTLLYPEIRIFKKDAEEMCFERCGEKVKRVRIIIL